MKSIEVFPANEFIEVYKTSTGKFISIHFYMARDEEDNLIDRYINALDVMKVLSYSNIYSAWDNLKKKFKFDIECTFRVVQDNKLIAQEDFITFTQLVILIKESPRMGIKEKGRFIEFIAGSLI